MTTTHYKNILIASLLGISAVNADAAIYWTQTGPGGFQTNGPAYVMRANDDGSGAAAIVSGDSRIKGPNGLESFAGELLWPDQQITGGKVNFDGSGYAQVPNLSGYDVDVTASKIYTTTGSGNSIRVMNPDGSNYVTLLSGLAFPFAVDATDSFLYWSEFNSQKIRRSNLDGTGVVDLIAGITAYEIQVTADYIYYADTFAADIWRSGLDGSGAVKLIDDSNGAYLNGIDVTSQYIYWSALNDLSGNGGTVNRANLDGSNPVNLYTAPAGIAVRGVVAAVPIPAGLPLFLSGLGVLVGVFRRCR